MKLHGGNLAPTSYMFTKRGRIVLGQDAGSPSAEDILDEAVEAGAEEVDADEDGNIVVSNSLWMFPAPSFPLVLKC